MLSKNIINSLKSLREKEWRKLANAFLVEWEKNIFEFLSSDFEFLEWYFSQAFHEKHQSSYDSRKVIVCSESEIDRISSLTSNRIWVAVFRMRDNTAISSNSWLTLVLDGINDPWNLGTIIRTADWYGISNIVASPNTVDAYNSKVIMATMGSFSRVNVVYKDLKEYLAGASWPVYWAYLEWEDIHKISEFPNDAHLVIWSESHGISPEIEKYITEKITIPRFGHTESLNAWVATAIILDNFKRKRN